MPTYIYAITAADHPLRLDGLSGVGEPAADLRTVKTRDLGAVVSDTPADLRAKRRDLVAHQSVLERLMADGAALPMRFGLVGPDDEQVRAALDQGKDSYTARLAELDGRLEYNLKVSREEESLLREILTQSAEARRLSEYTRGIRARRTRRWLSANSCRRRSRHARKRWRRTWRRRWRPPPNGSRRASPRRRTS